MSAGRSVNTKSTAWCTPPKYVRAVKEMFGVIYLDPCSNENSLVHAQTEYILPEHDGLTESWNFPTIYVNPPYGADRVRRTTIKNWLARCSQAHQEYSSEVLALVPVATNTAHWKKYVFPTATAICFLYDTRLRFVIDGSLDNKGAPMACCMIYWGNNVERFNAIFSQFGACIELKETVVPKQQPMLFEIV